MRNGTRLIPLALLLVAIWTGGCADNEYGEDERAGGPAGADDTPNAVAEPGFGESPVEAPGIGEGEEEWGSGSGGTMGEGVDIPVTAAPDSVAVLPR